MIRSNVSNLAPTGRQAVDGRGAPIALRSQDDIDAIERTGVVVAEAIASARAACRPGVRTLDIANAAGAVLERHGAEALSLGARPDPSASGGIPFPGAACVSVEDVVLHGVPGERPVLAGEIVSIDVAARLDGWCADAAISMAVGEVDAERARLLVAVEELLETAIDLVRPGVRWSTIARTMQELAFGAGYGLVEGFVGHGLGRDLHEGPAVPSQLTAGVMGREDFTLRPGMVLAIEPVLVAAGDLSGPALRGDGTASGVPVILGHDGWSLLTIDGAVAAHAEHTIAVGRSGARILTADPADHETTGAGRVAAVLLD